MAEPRLDAAEELRRIRREATRPRPRAPWRVIIASDPDRPVRTFVLPRALPRIAVGAVAGLALFAVISSLTSVRLGAMVGELRGRLGNMVRAAEDLTRHPLPQAQEAGMVPLAVPVRSPSGALGRFELESVNTGERMEVVLDSSTGEVNLATYKQLRHFMRCLRTGAETPVDPRLIELLYRLSLRTRQRILIVSGFRAPMFSTADLSYHTRGMAADIRIPGMTPLMVRDLAESMGVGGLGYYPTSQFVHVDVRTERARWIDYSHDKGDGEGREHGADPSLAAGGGSRLQAPGSSPESDPGLQKTVER